MTKRQKKPQHIFKGVCLAVVCSIASKFAFSNESAASCASIADNMERLACYDTFFRKGSAEQPTPPAPAKAQTPAQRPKPHQQPISSGAKSKHNNTPHPS